MDMRGSTCKMNECNWIVKSQMMKELTGHCSKGAAT